MLFIDFIQLCVLDLAYYLSLKIAPARVEALKLIYEDEILRAEKMAGSESSSYITPKAYYPSVS